MERDSKAAHALRGNLPAQARGCPAAHALQNSEHALRDCPAPGLRGNLALLLVLAFALLSLLALSGCASKNGYVPCCVREKIYDSALKQVVDGPVCQFPNGTVFGPCDKTSTNGSFLSAGVANCTNGQKCKDITLEGECSRTTTCNWNESKTPKCQEAATAAYWPMPVCVDNVPASCINNRCTAMMCGFTQVTPSPPPSSQDWDADNPQNCVDDGSGGINCPGAYSQNELSNLPATNLQATSCTFSTMNRKLYNKVRQSRGQLWVNSFRFGVGSSFSDFEQSRNFFPATDRLCSTTGTGIDRFTVYLNKPATWCAELSPLEYYRCSKNDLNFSSQELCLTYCNGDSGDCGSTAEQPQFLCNQDGFAYSDRGSCESKCNVIDDPGLCTSTNENSPYLNDESRYPVKYVADYLTDSTQVTAGDDAAFEQTCRLGQEWMDDRQYWDPDSHLYCNDFQTPDGEMTDGPWYPWGGDSDFRSYFETRKSPVLDFDYSYYAAALKEQYRVAGADLDHALPYECESAMQCISGACDMTNYKRALCKTDAGTVYCGVHSEGYGPFARLISDEKHPVMYAQRNNEIYNGIYEAVQVTNDLFTGQQEYDREPDTSVTFRFFSYGSVPNERLMLFESCGVYAPTTTVNMCLGRVDKQQLGGINNEYVIGAESFIAISLPDGTNCPAVKTTSQGDYNFTYTNLTSGNTPVGLYKYEVRFEANSNKPKVNGLPATCNLTDDRIKLPYFDLKNLGWCAGCTYSTLAVQNISWENGPGGPDASGSGVKEYACYQWRATMNYTVRNGIDSDKGNAYTSASVAPVRQSASGDAFDGNIERTDWDFPFIGEDRADFGCFDGWMGGSNFWANQYNPVPYPSAPYLRDKLTSYLQSNVMPILDERTASTNANSRQTVSPGIWGFVTTSSLDGTTKYPPVDLCRIYGGDGAAIHVIGDTGLISKTDKIHGSVYLNSASDSEFMAYMGMASGSGAYALNGTNAVLARAQLLKTLCFNSPITAIAINGYEDSSKTDDMGGLVNDEPGTLFQFFYQPGYDDIFVGGRGTRERMIYQGTPNKYADDVDLLLQEWYPTCDNAGSDLAEKTRIEFEKRMEFSRSLLSNFSKPSLIWKFHFPQNNDCYQTINGKEDYSLFLSYLFNNTGEMVNSGVMGLVYDSWMTESGKGYGAPTATFGPDPGTTAYTGLTKKLATGRLDDPTTASTTQGKVSTPFCELQRYSQQVAGITKNMYGQKLYAGISPCMCEECSVSDYALGFCDRKAAAAKSEDPNLPQLFCNDGKACTMPTDKTGQRTDTGNYKCPTTCMSAACKLCSDADYANQQSFCRIEQSGSSTISASKPYSSMSDTNWEFLAGLPASQKCCLQATDQNGIQTNYTYVSKTSTKQRSEFIQYPTRGEQGIDCGQTPDTTLLTYCNIRVPIDNRQFTCTKVTG